MDNNGGGDCTSMFCGCCCIVLFSALSSWCDTVAPYSCSIPNTFDDQVRQDMAKSKAEDAAKKQEQKQMEPTPNMLVSPGPKDKLVVGHSCA